MYKFTNERNDDTLDEIWLVEHYPVFTQGKFGKTEHISMPGGIPLIQSNRGGQITYHGPGQQIMYVLLNLRRRKLQVRELIFLLEKTVVDTLAEYGIGANPRSNNEPGVYISGKKICSLGLHIQKGCSSHGLALNVNMDLAPFSRINPCGHFGMEMIQMRQFIESVTSDIVRPILIDKFLILLNKLSRFN